MHKESNLITQKAKNRGKDRKIQILRRKKQPDENQGKNSNQGQQLWL